MEEHVPPSKTPKPSPSGIRAGSAGPRSASPQGEGVLGEGLPSPSY
jgi:hypothetical protein